MENNNKRKLTNYDLERIHDAALLLHKNVHFKDVPVHLQGTVCFIKAFADYADVEVEVPDRRPYQVDDDY